MNILTINCGSSSVKYQLLNLANNRLIQKGKIERIGEGQTHVEAVGQLLSEIKSHKISAIGHRIVHGGETFQEATLIDDSVIEAIEECIPLAPLHNPANLAGIHAAQKLFPDIPHVAVFDTAFHVKLPRRARYYGIDPELADRLRIRRYGFHGPSHAYVSQRAAEFLQRPLNELRLISCHLGSGASVCAIEMGQSVETSMGMTPLEGLMMGTRSGDLDPAIVLTLLRDGRTIDEVDQLLNKESGLKGVSGVGMDLRDITQAAVGGNDRARLAIGLFAHRVRKYIGAYVAVMGGVDAIILTAGVGENSVSMRRRILQRFEYLGLALNDEQNEWAKVDLENPVVEISTRNSKVKALVVATNEELMIAQETNRLVQGGTVVSNPGPIPIAISARHVHLDQETVYQLFGEGYQLTHRNDLSQPGQFACEETVNLIGPRNKIENVRILGPLRRQSQIEISRTDEFLLKVDAPIRASGKLAGSAPITLEGPNGLVHLQEGLICARRHIHMTPQDAEQYGVVDGDEVEVAIVGGPRDLVFGDVLIRVNPNYKLEMHIDTDEGNAAELSRQSNGKLVYTEIGQAQAGLRKKKL